MELGFFPSWDFVVDGFRTTKGTRVHEGKSLHSGY